jgi:A/G-specific adenine glycosylase
LFELLKRLDAMNGVIPESQDELVLLPGVGEYTAAAMLSLHMGKRAVLIDSNVVRLLARLTGNKRDGETRRRPWLRDFADRLTPHRRVTEYNYGLLDLAMTICGRTPACCACPLREQCATGGASSATTAGGAD